MSKLSFRARQLDPSKLMPIFYAEELPDLPEYSAINRQVPIMPSGMEKEEESEHHLQRAICAGLIIPTPEVFEIDPKIYDKYYPADYKMPKQYIHMQPLAMEQDIPDYDMDSADETWVNSQARRLDITPYKFEQMMDRLEKSSGQTVVTLNEAKALLKQDDEISIAVYDYWLNKRLKTQHPLILSVKTENRPGTATNNPYLAFRRRTEKMQTRKNRKNDEASYEKMLKLRRDLSRAVTLLDLIKRREKAKREQLHLGIEIFEKRYQTRDFSGQLFAEFSSNISKNSRSAFAPIYTNQYSHSHTSLTTSASNQWPNSGTHHYSTSPYPTTGQTSKRDIDVHSVASSRKEKRQYKKRKHKNQRDKSGQYASPGPTSMDIVASSEDEELTGTIPPGIDVEEEGLYTFRRNKNNQYHKPLSQFGNWPWEPKSENGLSDPKYRFTLTSIRHPKPRCIGFSRRRIGRGGRVILDRISTNMDEFWAKLDYTIIESDSTVSKIHTTNNKLKYSSDSNNSIVVNKNDSILLKQKLSEQILLRTNNCKNVIKNDNILSDDLQQTVVDVIKKEKFDNEFDKILGNSNVNSVFDSSTSSSSLRQFSVKRENDVYNKSSSGVSSSNLLTSGLSSSLSQELVLSNSNESEDVTLNKFKQQNENQIKSEPFEIDLSNINNNNNYNYNNKINLMDEDEKYLNEALYEEIKKEWLHFRPATPPTPPILSDCIDAELNQLSESTPMTVELQTLEKLPPSLTIFQENYDNLFLTNPFSLCDLADDRLTTMPNLETSVSSASTSGLELNSSSDSLTEFNLGLDESNEDNEKMLDNILQECQIEDLKSFHTNTNFWNGILDDNGLLNSLDIIDDKKDLPKIGYDSEFVFNNDRQNKNNGKARKLYSTRVGHSSFNVVNNNKDNFFKKDSPKSTEENNSTSNNNNNNKNNNNSVEIKTEEAVQNLPQNQTQQPQLNHHHHQSQQQHQPIENTTQTVMITQQPINSIVLPNSAIIQQQSHLQEKSTTENMIIMASPPKKQINGPQAERNAIQNLFKQTINVRTMPTTSNKLDDDNIYGKKDIECYVKVPISEFSVASNNLNAINANHNYSLSPNTMPSSIIVASGQNTPQSKIIINSSLANTSTLSGTGTSNITIPPSIQELLTSGQNKIQLNTTPKIVNLVSTSNNQQDVKNLLTSGLIVENKNNVDVKTLVTAAAANSSPQQKVKVEKTLNMLYDSEKNRILYANLKNNRGQFLAQINPKLVNLLPVAQNQKNNTTNVQTVVASSPSNLLSKSQVIQTQQQQQHIQQLQQQQQQQQTQTQQRVVINPQPQNITTTIRTQQSSDITKIIQNNDKTPITGININTTNR